MKKLLLSVFTLSCFAGFSQWVYTGNNTSNDVIAAFGSAFASDGLIAGTSGLYSTPDNGATWANSNTGVPSTGLIFGTFNSGSLYAFKSNSVYVSTSGNNWSLQPSTMSSSLTIKSMTSLNGTVIAAASPNSPASFKIYHFVGGTWTLKSSPANAMYITCIRNLGGTLFAGTTASNIIKSSDAGMTWTTSSTGAPTQNAHKYNNCLASSGNTMYCGTIGGRIVRSTNSGSNWSSVYNIGDDNGFYGINDFYVYNTNTVFAATDSGFVYTTNGGNSWTRYNVGLNFGNFENLMKRVTVSGNNVIAGVNTSSGARVVRMPLSSIGISAGINELTSGKLENKVYPNPTSGNVTIEVSDLTFEDNCIVKLYDAMGRVVLTSVMNSGKAQLDLENYSAGLYSFTVLNNNTIASRGKLVVN
jgi:photosystem II stability/assembly factor-like uncharacterized protein